MRGPRREVLELIQALRAIARAFDLLPLAFDRTTREGVQTLKEAIDEFVDSANGSEWMEEP